MAPAGRLHRFEPVVNPVQNPLPSYPYPRWLSRFSSLVLALTLGLGLVAGCESLGDLESILDSSGSTNQLSQTTIANGLREALTVGTERVVTDLGRDGGYLNSSFRIPLPDRLASARDTAARFGLDGSFNELEVRLNEAAELATPKAKALFVGAVKQMSFSDVMSVYRGADDAATRYLRRTTEDQLRLQMMPLIDNSLNQVGAVRSFNDLVSTYNAIPLVKPIDANLSDHVLDYASNALFSRLAEEEAAIRSEPMKRTTELLRLVFGR